MEIDTGAAVSIISEETYKKLWNTNDVLELLLTSTTLGTYTGESIGVLGKINVKVRLTDKQHPYHYWL